MADIRGPDDRDLAKTDYLNGMKYRELAEKYQVSLNTIKSWVKRYGWANEKKQRGAHKNKRGAPLNNKNAVGHGAPKRNKNAETHGLFTKYLPDETLSIMQEIETLSPIDMLWDQIMLQYAAIIRSQRIMYVESKEKMIKELKKKKEYDGETVSSTEVEYEFQFAWDRQATFLNAQSRAMSELRNMIKQYDELLNANRDIATQEQKLRIEKLKVDIEKVKGADKDKSIEIVIKRKGEG